MPPWSDVLSNVYMLGFQRCHYQTCPLSRVHGFIPVIKKMPALNFFQVVPAIYIYMSEKIVFKEVLVLGLWLWL
jgi:hypothetical protein